MGFAEFVGKLLTETFEAIVESQLDQSEALMELSARARMSREEYMIKFLSFDQAMAEAQTAWGIAPDLAAPLTTAAVAKLVRDLDFQAGEHYEADSLRLTSHGINQVLQEANFRIVDREQALLRSAILQAPPRFIVDSGSVSVKLHFTVITQEDGTTQPAAPGGAQPTGAATGRSAASERRPASGPLARGQFAATTRLKLSGMQDVVIAEPLVKPDGQAPKSRIVVHQARSSNTQTEIASEVTIRFKSV